MMLVASVLAIALMLVLATVSALLLALDTYLVRRAARAEATALAGLDAYDRLPAPRAPADAKTRDETPAP